MERETKASKRTEEVRTEKKKEREKVGEKKDMMNKLKRERP